MYSIVSSPSVRLALRSSSLRSLSTANLNDPAPSSNTNTNTSTNTNPQSILTDQIQLPNVERLNSFKDRQLGIPGLISNPILNDLWFNQLSTKLIDFKDYISQSTHNDYSDCFTNDTIQSTEISNKVINQYKNLLEKMSKKFDDNDSPLFDLTASIYNLFYFFSSIKATNSNEIKKLSSNDLLTFTPNLTNKPLDSNFIHLINKSFGSIEEFLTLFNDSANSIKGNGYTYLVYKHIENSKVFSKLGHLSILNVYNNGIPHTFTSKRVSNGKEFEKKKNQFNNINNNNNSFIPSMDDAEAMNNLDFTFIPLVSIGSNPSFYLRDYGVYGKKLYINNAINSIDWDVVVSRIPSK